MSLFQCDKCGCIENTALSTGGYLGRILINRVSPEVLESYRKDVGLKSNEKFGTYCCVCTPYYINEKENKYDIKPENHTKWHDKFPRRFLPKGEWQTDRQGNLENKKTKEKDYHKYTKNTEFH